MREINSEIEQFMQEGMQEVMAEMDRAGRAGVEYNIANGNYQNRTGNLRRSNFYEVDEEGLTIGNSADYANHVEAKGYMVCSEGALLALQMLNGN